MNGMAVGEMDFDCTSDCTSIDGCSTKGQGDILSASLADRCSGTGGTGLRRGREILFSPLADGSELVRRFLRRHCIFGLAWM